MAILNKKASFGQTVAIMGAILIAIGFAWLIAQNWHEMSAVVKIIILTVLTIASLFAGIKMRIMQYPGIGESLIFLGSCLYTLSVFLIAQIFSTETTLQGTAWLFLLALIGVTAFSYIFSSGISLVLALIEFMIWINLQFFALMENPEMIPAIVAAQLLFLGMFFYGLNLLHKDILPDFAKIYKWWTVLYILVFGYVLTFQGLLPIMWEGALGGPALIFAIIVILVSLIVFVYALTKSISKINKKEMYGVIAVIGILLILIFSTYLVKGKVGTCEPRNCYDSRTQDQCAASPANLNCEWNNDYCNEASCYNYRDETSCLAATRLKCTWDPQYSNCNQKEFKNDWQQRSDSCNNLSNDECNSSADCKFQIGNVYSFGNKNIPFIAWFIWVLVNITYIAIIVAFVAYGTWVNEPAIINCAMMFFALDIISRYIGFMMDLWGYTSLSVVFITGGIILIAGGFGIEKWRRLMIEKAKNTKN